MIGTQMDAVGQTAQRLLEMTRAAELRRRVRLLVELPAVYAEALRFFSELGFPRSLLLLDVTGFGVLTIDAVHGFEEHSGISDVRKTMRVPRADASELHAGVPEAMCRILELEEALSVPLGPTDSPLGFVIVGHAAHQPSWPEDGPRILAEAAPELHAAMFHSIFHRLRDQERQVMSAQHDEIEALLHEVEKRDEELAAELEHARAFQVRLLSVPVNLVGWTTEVHYRAAHVVSGDLYDVFVDGARMIALVGDLTGHGVRAALATMVVKAQYEAVKHEATTPRDILELLNRRLVHAYGVELAMTAACCAIDLPSGAFSYAAAAHPPAIIVSGGRSWELPAGGGLVGVTEELTCVEATGVIAPDGALYLYSDGLSEGSGPGGALFGEERVLHALVRGHELGRGTAEVMDAFSQFTSPVAPADDLTILGLRRSAAARDATRDPSKALRSGLPETV